MINRISGFILFVSVVLSSTCFASVYHQTCVGPGDWFRAKFTLSLKTKSEKQLEKFFKTTDLGYELSNDDWEPIYFLKRLSPQQSANKDFDKLKVPRTDFFRNLRFAGGYWQTPRFLGDKRWQASHPPRAVEDPWVREQYDISGDGSAFEFMGETSLKLDHRNLSSWRVDDSGSPLPSLRDDTKLRPNDIKPLDVNVKIAIEKNGRPVVLDGIVRYSKNENYDPSKFPQKCH